MIMGIMVLMSFYRTVLNVQTVGAKYLMELGIMRTHTTVNADRRLIGVRRINEKT